MIVLRFVKDKVSYREWDLLPRVTIVFENKDFLGIAFGWLIYGFVVAIKPSELTRRLKL